MEYDVRKLEENIDNFFSGVLSKDDLGSWAKRAYLDLLKGVDYT